MKASPAVSDGDTKTNIVARTSQIRGVVQSELVG